MKSKLLSEPSEYMEVIAYDLEDGRIMLDCWSGATEGLPEKFDRITLTKLEVKNLVEFIEESKNDK